MEAKVSIKIGQHMNQDSEICAVTSGGEIQISRRLHPVTRDLKLILKTLQEIVVSKNFLSLRLLVTITDLTLELRAAQETQVLISIYEYVYHFVLD